MALRSRWRGATAMTLAVGFVACGGTLSDAVSRFDAGQYPAAERELALLDGDAPQWSVPRQAQYALYRGLTLGALGDEVHAAAWLHRAAVLEQAYPGALSSLDERRLNLVEATLSSDDSD